MVKQAIEKKLETANKFFELEQKDVKNLVYWKKSYRQSFVFKNLDKIKKLYLSKNKPVKKKVSLTLWLFYQHSFQSIVSNDKGKLKNRFNKKIASQYSKLMSKYYLHYWGSSSNKNIFHLLAKAFIDKDLETFTKTLKDKKDKVWTLNNKLIKSMFDKISK